MGERSHIFMDDKGVARTVNRRVKVKMIGEKHIYAGESAVEIAEHYGIDLADVHAALTHYYDHRAEYEKRSDENQRLLHENGQSGREVIRRLRQKKVS